MGFEPTDAFTSPVFKTGSLNRSDISPNRFQATHRILAHLPLFVNTFSKKSFNFFALKFFWKFWKKGLHFGIEYVILTKLTARAAANKEIRVWRSLVSRLNGVQEASSSNLDTRTKSARWFWYETIVLFLYWLIFTPQFDTINSTNLNLTRG